MSEDVDKICRAIFYNIRIAKTLDEATQAVEVIIGEHNAALVNDKLAKSDDRK